jgi:hypothetical protein
MQRKKFWLILQKDSVQYLCKSSLHTIPKDGLDLADRIVLATKDYLRLYHIVRTVAIWKHVHEAISHK